MEHRGIAAAQNNRIERVGDALGKVSVPLTVLEKPGEAGVWSLAPIAVFNVTTYDEPPSI